MRRLLLPILFVALALTSCGGGGDPEEANELVDTAFTEEMFSADLKIDAEVQLEGSPVFERPLRIQAAGPFRTNEGKLPSVDPELEIGTDGGGQTVTTGFLSTGDRAFMKFQDVYYELRASEVRRANRDLARRQGRRGSLHALGLDPRSWLLLAENKGQEDVAGVETLHASGTLDVESFLHDLNRFVERSGSALGGAAGQAPPPRLSEADIRELTEAVQDPTFDIYVGKADDIIRRVSGRVEFEIPKRSRAGLGGLDGGSIVFSVEFRDVNGDQEIEAPASARPLSDLTESLGAGGLPGGLGGGGEEPEVPAPPDMPSGGSGGGSDDPEAFRRYAECLDNARPEDTDELQRCAELLEEP